MEAIKIIRDNIPKIAANSGAPMVVKYVDDKEALQFLIKKLDEELAEFKKEINLILRGDIKTSNAAHYEMIDLIDVMEAVLDKVSTLHKAGLTCSPDALAREKRCNGLFNDNIVLLK